MQKKISEVVEMISKKPTYDTTTLIRISLRIQFGRVQSLPSTAIVMGDATLQGLASSQCRFVRVCNNVDESNAIQPDHLLKVDEASVISVDVLKRFAEISTIPIRFQDAPPEGIREFRGS